MARRARRGLAELSDSEEEQSGIKNIDSIKGNSISLFETKVFTDNVLSKIREEEAKVTNFEGLKNISNAVETFTTREESPDLLPKQKRNSVCQKSAKRCKLVELLSSDDDAEDELDELLRSTSATNPTVSTIDHDGDNQEDRTGQGGDSEEEDETFLNESQDESDELDGEGQNDYRILVKHLGVDGGIWVRIKKSDTMQRVFDETQQATGVGVTLMIDIDGEREEVLPTHTAVDLGMSVERCAVVYSYPAPVEEVKFKLKFVTTDRRATKEIECDRDESFAQIFQRYCEQNNLTRNSVVFKFDGDVLDDAQTPQDQDMESGEQIEAHNPAEIRPPTSSAANTEIEPPISGAANTEIDPPTSSAENTETGRRVSTRQRNRRAAPCLPVPEDLVNIDVL